jgi:hypothetical protein
MQCKCNVVNPAQDSTGSVIGKAKLSTEREKTGKFNFFNEIDNSLQGRRTLSILGVLCLEIITFKILYSSIYFQFLVVIRIHCIRAPICVPYLVLIDTGYFNRYGTT